MSMSDASDPIHPMILFIPIHSHRHHYSHCYVCRRGFPLIVLIVLWKIRPTNMSDGSNPITFVCSTIFLRSLHHHHHLGPKVWLHLYSDDMMIDDYYMITRPSKMETMVSLVDQARSVLKSVEKF